MRTPRPRALPPFRRLSTLVLVTPLLAMTASTVPLHAADIVVSATSDAIIAGDFRCTLREAIIAANTDTAFSDCTAGSGADTLVLGFSTPHNIALAGTNEDQALTGDFDVRDDLTIRPMELDVVVEISGQDLDRVFDVHDGADLTLKRIHVRDGDVIGFGGGIFTSNPASRLNLYESEVTHNTATLFGGGIYSEGLLQITSSFVAQNQAAFGGGVYMGTEEPLILYESDVWSNFADSDGAGIHAVSVEAESSLIRANAAVRHGGGVFLRDEGIARPSHLVNSTVYSNSSQENGAGIYTDTVGSLDLFNVTITRNESDAGETDRGDGALFVQSGTVRLHNSVVAGNDDFSIEVAGHLAPDCFGTVTSEGHNVFGAVDLADCVVQGDTTGNFVGTLAAPFDAQLCSLGFFGGPTRTSPPDVTSPLLDAGDADGCAGPNGVLTRDQRRTLRPWDGPDPDTDARCDIGAVEVGSLAFDLLFDDNFETGDLDTWNASVLTSGALTPSSGAAKGDPDCNPKRFVGTRPVRGRAP